MARTIDQIYQSLLAEKATFSTLDGLNDSGVTNVQELINTANSDSIVSEHILWMYLFANESSLTEQVFDQHKAEVQALIDVAFVGTPEWLIDTAKEFQYGDLLVVDPITYAIGYAVVDETKQLIGSVAITESANSTIMKVRGKNSNLLSVDELTAFNGYINKIKIAGQNIVVWNYSPDTLKLYMTIIYSKQFPLSTIQSNVENVINDYVKNIEFNSFFNVNTLIDKLQAIDGMIDPRFDSGEGRFDVNAYVPFTHEYFATAGYCTIDNGFPLNTTITYISK